MHTIVSFFATLALTELKALVLGVRVSSDSNVHLVLQQSQDHQSELGHLHDEDERQVWGRKSRKAKKGATQDSILASRESMCCKCSEPAKNGKRVYSCSWGGYCGMCTRYGGRANATKIPALLGDNCETRKLIGAHYACRNAFEVDLELELQEQESEGDRKENEEDKDDEADQPPTSSVGDVGGESVANPRLEGKHKNEEPQDEPPEDESQQTEDKDHIDAVDSESDEGLQNDTLEEALQQDGPYGVFYEGDILQELLMFEKHIAEEGAQDGPVAEETQNLERGPDSSEDDSNSNHDSDEKLAESAELPNLTPKLKKNTSAPVGEELNDTSSSNESRRRRRRNGEQPGNNEPMCCKCSKPGSNGKSVYFCSTKGSCHSCTKYGGQKNAIKKLAPPGGRCSKGGQVGAHYDCKKVFRHAQRVQKLHSANELLALEKRQLEARLEMEANGVGWQFARRQIEARDELENRGWRDSKRMLQKVQRMQREIEARMVMEDRYWWSPEARREAARKRRRRRLQRKRKK